MADGVRALRSWCRDRRNGLLFLVPSTVAAPAAQAGSLWVTDGGGNCNAFSVYGERRAVRRPLGVPDVDPDHRRDWLGQNAYWMTTAPPGITINQAWTANGDVNAGGWTPGVVVGDFWRDVNTGAWGGSTLAQGQQWFNTGLEGSSRHQQPDLRHPARLH